MSESIIPLGLCQCGCGQKTTIAKNTNARAGHLQGQPVRFIHGHNVRRSPYPYLIQDRGYDTPCWVWQWWTDEDGYGRAYSGTAHKREYVRRFGRVPYGLQLHHKCEVRACINPEHLTPVTPAMNAQASSNAKLDWGKVRDIRHKFESGQYSQKALSREHGVSRATIKRVVTYETWCE